MRTYRVWTVPKVISFSMIYKWRKLVNKRSILGTLLEIRETRFFQYTPSIHNTARIWTSHAQENSILACDSDLTLTIECCLYIDFFNPLITSAKLNYNIDTPSINVPSKTCLQFLCCAAYDAYLQFSAVHISILHLHNTVWVMSYVYTIS